MVVVAWPPEVVIEQGDIQSVRIAIFTLVVPIERENDVLAAHSFDFALPHDWEDPMIVAKIRIRLEARQRPEEIGVFGEGEGIFVLETKELVDLLFGRDSPCVDWPEDVFSVGRLAGIYLIII